MKNHFTIVGSLILILYLYAGYASAVEENIAVNVPKENKPTRQVILTLGSWRKDDVQQISYILGKFTEQHPAIVIKFDPTPPSEYNDVIKAQLENDSAPDLFYLRSFSNSKQLYKKGYLTPLNNLPNIKNNFSAETLEAWSSDEGDIYGVPFMAVSHGIYYNATIFDKMGLSIPNTWEELLALSNTIKTQGMIPFANTTGDAWTTNGLILQNVISNVIGGKAGRLDYYEGRRCFNDQQMIEAFQSVEDISHLVSENHNLLKYLDSLQLFVQQKSPMRFGGSWEIPFFEAQKINFDWRVFAIPPPAGKKHIITFHPDAAIGLNRASPRAKEAKLFLQWMASDEFSTLVADQLPGFFPMHKHPPTIKNQHAQMFLDFNKKFATDIRFVWGKIRDGDPSAYDLSVTASTDLMNQRMTPKQAADYLQNGLSQWYLPARLCPH